MNVNDEQSEFELTVASVAGDALALQMLLFRYQRRLLEYIKRHLPAALATTIGGEDVLQDTCMEAVRRIADFVPGPDGGFLRWLMTIARHRIIDLLRAQNAEKRGSGRLVDLKDDGEAGVIRMLETLAVYHRTPSRSAAAHELTAALERSIDRLPPDYRQAIRLRHVEGLPAKDAAARMNRTEGAFHLLCNRGLKKLRIEMRSESIYV